MGEHPGVEQQDYWSLGSLTMMVKFQDRRSTNATAPLVMIDDCAAPERNKGWGRKGRGNGRDAFGAEERAVLWPS